MNVVVAGVVSESQVNTHTMVSKTNHVLTCLLKVCVRCLQHGLTALLALTAGRGRALCNGRAVFSVFSDLT